MKPVRVFYEKKDTAKYISHLDINRCFQRAIRRAEVAIWYTEGFNPHAYITFALPLSLGHESEYETMDMRLLDEDMPLDEVMARLNRALPAGLRVWKAAMPSDKPDAIAWSDYRVLMAPEGEAAQETAQKFRAFLERESIPAKKRTKRGEREIDLRPYVQLLSLACTPEGVQAELRLAAGSEMNVNPTLVLDCFCAACGTKFDHVQVTRTAVWNKKGENFA